MKIVKLDLGVRPKCEHPGCQNTAQFTGHYNKDGTPRWRKVDGVHLCQKHHSDLIAKKRGKENIGQVIAENAGYDSHGEYLNAKAVEEGFISHTQKMNRNHPSLKHRKNYCENIDGRLGFVCTTTLPAEFELAGILHVDHIDGCSENNDPDNLQTLCPTCHAFKTWKNGDAKTPGRKTLRLLKNAA